MEKNKNEPMRNLAGLASQIITSVMDEETRAAYLDICKMQLASYEGFISAGCTPQEALRQTATYMEASIRAARKD